MNIEISDEPRRKADDEQTEDVVTNDTEQTHGEDQKFAHLRRMLREVQFKWARDSAKRRTLMEALSSGKIIKDAALLVGETTTSLQKAASKWASRYFPGMRPRNALLQGLIVMQHFDDAKTKTPVLPEYKQLAEIMANDKLNVREAAIKAGQNPVAAASAVARHGGKRAFLLAAGIPEETVAAMKFYKEEKAAAPPVDTLPEPETSTQTGAIDPEDEGKPFWKTIRAPWIETPNRAILMKAFSEGARIPGAAALIGSTENALSTTAAAWIRKGYFAELKPKAAILTALLELERHEPSGVSPEVIAKLDKLLEKPEQLSYRGRPQGADSPRADVAKPQERKVDTTEKQEAHWQKLVALAQKYIGSTKYNKTIEERLAQIVDALKGRSIDLPHISIVRNYQTPLHGDLPPEALKGYQHMLPTIIIRFEIPSEGYERVQKGGLERSREVQIGLAYLLDQEFKKLAAKEKSILTDVLGAPDTKRIQMQITENVSREKEDVGTKDNVFRRPLEHPPREKWQAALKP